MIEIVYVTLKSHKRILTHTHNTNSNNTQEKNNSNRNNLRKNRNLKI